MGIELLEGRTFSDEFGSDSASIIFNETAIAAMGIDKPIGKTIRHYSGDKQIIGVVKDFNLNSLHTQVEPTLFLYGLAWLFGKLGVSSGMEGGMMGLFIAFVFVMMPRMTNDMFAQNPYGLSWIVGGFSMAAMTLSGFVLGAWRKGNGATSTMGGSPQAESTAAPATPAAAASGSETETSGDSGDSGEE